MAPALTAGRRANPSPALATAILAAIAVAARWRTFGNPVIKIDEQWYLLVAGRMLGGALPYVDMFDRKPIGIFLLYAVARLFGGGGVLAYQLMALAAAVATAGVLFAMARRVAPPWAALAGAALYVLALSVAEGEGGQSPVFYNLPIAVAAWLAMRALVEPDAERVRRRGVAAMLLVGAALQIKYSVVFEGLFLGAAFLLASRRAGRPPAAIAIDAIAWMAAAALPTLVAAAVYAGLGHWHEWAFANITANLTRQSEEAHLVRKHLRRLIVLSVPVMLAVPIRRFAAPPPQDARARAAIAFADAWLLASLAGIVVYGTWYDHYVLPLFAPGAIAAAALWRGTAGRLYLAALLACAAVGGQLATGRHMRARGDEAVVAALARLSAGQPGCPFVYQAMPVLYDRLGACLPTTRAFPGHLNEVKELGATGIDEVAEIGRIMAARPRRVVSVEPMVREEYPPAREALYRVLRADYVPIYSHPLGRRRTLVLYALRGTAPPR